MNVSREDVILWLNKPIDEERNYLMSDYVEEIFNDIIEDLDKANLYLRHDKETLFINLVFFLYRHSNTKINF